MAGITRPMSQMRKLETKEALFRARKRILKYLVHAFLKQEGFHMSADCLANEGNLTGEYEVCDNIDLDIILQDYCSYYLQRFNKQPQFCRKVEIEPPKRPATRRSRPEVMQETPPVPQTREASLVTEQVFTVTKLGKDENEDNTTIRATDQKPLSVFLRNATAEKKELAEMLYQTIMRADDGVTWSDVKGLDSAKSLLMESVVYPIRHPELFTGLLSPWRGILLHGPPGTGKTMLARVVAADAQCTFFNISCSTVVNKWRGESEKIVQVLFELASYYAPSIVFVDEAEWVAGARARGDHEASRRLTAQLLAELDGLRARGQVFLLANTNAPWEIDPAMLRRLEKRIYIPLPDHATRVQLFQAFLDSMMIDESQATFDELARRTNGYSGSDIKLVCKEALMNGVRKMLPNMKSKGIQQNRKEKLNLKDIFTAIDKTKPVSKNLTQKHIEWQNEMGSS